MSNLKDFIVKNLIVIIIAALVGGFFGSYFTYRLNNLSTEKRNEEITKQLMLFIHNEIYENYYSNLNTGYNYELLLSVEGLELLNLRAGNLTIKERQLSSLNRMYIDFSICNNKIKTWVGATPDMEQYFWEEVQKWRKICRLDIEEYEKEFCKDKSLKSEIKIE